MALSVSSVRQALLGLISLALAVPVLAGEAEQKAEASDSSGSGKVHDLGEVVVTHQKNRIY